MSRESKKQRLLEERDIRFIPHHKHRSGAGFTIVEILVVIAIITIFTSIAFVSLHIVMVKNRDTIRIYDLKQIALGLEMYHLDTGKYPTSLDNDAEGGWDVGNVKKMGSDDTFIQPLVDRGIFSKTPVETSLSDENSYRYYHYDADPTDPPKCFGKAFYILAAKLEGSQTNYHAADEVDSCYNSYNTFWQDDYWHALMRFE